MSSKAKIEHQKNLEPACFFQLFSQVLALVFMLKFADVNKHA